MKAVSKIMTAGVGLAALVGAAAPAAAQYYPGYGSGGNVVGQILGQVLGANRGYNYGNNSQYAVQQCSAAVQHRINRSYGGYGSQYGYGNRYGYGNQYGYAQQGQGRVLGVTSVERRNNGLRVRGVATANAYGQPYGHAYGYGGGYGYNQPQGELRFKCNINYRGQITDLDLTRNTNYGYRRY